MHQELVLFYLSRFPLGEFKKIKIKGDIYKCSITRAFLDLAHLDTTHHATRSRV